ncbi:MAG: CRISPR system precrRNA processing endoribonuclease RAMP protein Cas6 [Desulfobacterales bacterium]|nr:CRISPR system precrRNA processing endoribonuclease RAMP protein Cas6 [Desulfobacterales bacterium]
MLYGNYLFSSTLKDDAVLPSYKGSTFRGVFGHALKKVVCALKRQDCQDCLLRLRCVYPFVFEAQALPDEPKGRKRIASPPHPYAIEPPGGTKTDYKKAEPFEFTLLLFGKANDYLPYFIYAFEQMGRLGIGKRIGGKRAGFLLERVTTNGKRIYSNQDKKLTGGNFVRDLELQDFAMPEDRAVQRVEISLKTPLRLKFENKLEASLPFHVLVRAMLRRISSLANYHGNGEPTLDYRGMVQRAKAVEITDSSIKWFDWKRYSNKQDQSMLMGGIVGSVVYSGDLGEFLPLIRFCERVHVGKQTSFGLGKIEITTPTLPSPSKGEGLGGGEKRKFLYNELTGTGQ